MVNDILLIFGTEKIKHTKNWFGKICQKIDRIIVDGIDKIGIGNRY
jgi:hypothetical protein